MKQRFLYYMLVRYDLEGQSKQKTHTELEQAPIIYETNVAYYVAKDNTTYEEFMKKYAVFDEEQKKYTKINAEKCYRVNKRTMRLDVEMKSRAYRQYYTNIKDPIDVFYKSMYARRIGEALKNTDDAKLLREVAKKLNIQNITELKYSDAILKEIKGE